MEVRAKNRTEASQRNDEQSRRLLASEEQVRKEVASMLHSNVQTRLSACNVWLSMAEKLLREPDPALAVSDSEALAERIEEALSLMQKVRSEVERLRKADVQQAVQRLYPTLIKIGLRPALEGLGNLLRDQEQAPGVHAGECVSSAAERETAEAEACSTLIIDWMFSDGFTLWDSPGGTEDVLYVRLETYRLLEALLQAIQAACKVFYARPFGPGFASRDFGKQPLRIQVWLDVYDGELQVSARGHMSDCHPPDPSVIRFIDDSLPRLRFEKAGGTLGIETGLFPGFQMRAALPVP